MDPLARHIQIRHLDKHILVVNKPAGLTTVRHKGEVEKMGKRAKKFLPPTLVDLLPQVLPPSERRGRIRAVHRLDKETSGLLVLARTPDAESELGLQFRAHSIERRYLALVRGNAKSMRIESSLIEDRGDGRRGSGPSGQRAVTHVKVLEKVSGKEMESSPGESPRVEREDYVFSLVECRLETGRTHQVRIHLAEHGLPLCGEKVYDRPLHGAPLPDKSGARRPLLHAAFLALKHPKTGKWMEFHADMPPDMTGLLQKLRKSRQKGQSRRHAQSSHRAPRDNAKPSTGT